LQTPDKTLEQKYVIHGGSELVRCRLGTNITRGVACQGRRGRLFTLAGALPAVGKKHGQGMDLPPILPPAVHFSVIYPETTFSTDCRRPNIPIQFGHLLIVFTYDTMDFTSRL